jgi:hypothetical protein
MLRQLPDSLADSDYDKNFLQNNCATVDESGRILDLYIAMSHDTISWAEMRNLGIFFQGLEENWIYNPYLDGPSTFKEEDTPDRPSAGDILRGWTPPNLRLKRKEPDRSKRLQQGEDEEEQEPLEEDHVEKIKLLLKAKNMDPLRMKVKLTTSISHLISYVQDSQNVLERKDVLLYFDGEKLDPNTTIANVELGDMDTVEILYR